jgi:hypothetical protein
MLSSSWLESARRAVVAAVALFSAIGLLEARADDSPFVVRGPRNSAEAKILAELGKPTDMVFIEAPLSDVIVYLKDRHGIEIVPDQLALDDTGVGTDQPVTIELEGISLRAALEIMLRSLQLTYTVQNEVLLITTPEAHSRQLITAVYDVRDLLGGPSADDLADVLRALRGDASGDAKIVVYDTMLLVRDTDQAHQAMAELLHIMRTHLNKETD